MSEIGAGAAPAGMGNATPTADGGVASLRAAWAARAPRERLLLAIGGAALLATLLWTLAVQPAWRTLQRTPAQLAQAEGALQRMRAQAAEVQQLRAVAPVPMAQAQAALQAATGRLGDAAQLSLQGERAVVTLKGLSGSQLGAWLAEARAGARARVVEASLNQTAPGRFDGSLTLALGGGAR